MGTRNYTKIYYKGKLVLSQYGQWDGYPTGQLAVICDFLSNPRNEKLLRLNLHKIRTGKQPFKFNEKENKILDKYYNVSERKYKPKFEGDYFGRYNVEQQLQILRNGKMTNAEAVFALANNRDIGADILELIASPSMDKIKTLKMHFHCENEEEEGNYTVNLDERKIYAKYHGAKKVFSFDKLPTEKELQKWQDRVDEEK